FSNIPAESASAAEEYRIITNMCERVRPANYEETGCAVYDQLTLKSNFDLNYDTLNVSGVTQKDRTFFEAPIEEIEGPVMLEECGHVCADCEARFLKKIMPLASLANHICKGNIPWQLQDLSYAEKILVAKVRHNQSVVRIVSGRGKLRANAIT
ncbi:hypothetical protein DFH09DRAFT_856964, partial [Mycena vulgaris]